MPILDTALAFALTMLVVATTYFPHICRQEGVTLECRQKNNLGGWALWVLGIVLTAGLAGLGAPFWYDAIRGISCAVEGTRTTR